MNDAATLRKWIDEDMGTPIQKARYIAELAQLEAMPLAPIKLSINREYSGKLPKDATREDWGKFNGGFIPMELTIDGLITEIQEGHAFTAFLNGYRKSENFISTQHLGLDFDTEDDRSSLARLAQDDFISNFGGILYTSPSHEPHKPRARVVFILDKPITDSSEYRSMARALVDKFELTDQKCTDPARLWFASKGCEVIKLGHVLPVQILRDTVLKPYQEKQQELSKYIPRSTSGNHSGSDKVKWAESLLERLSPWRCDDYGAWTDVGMALSELGDNGLQLWDTWSQNSAKYQPGLCAEKWSTFKREGLTLGSLYHWAEIDSPFVAGEGANMAENNIPESPPEFIDDNNLKMVDSAETIELPQPDYAEFNPESFAIPALPDDILNGIDGSESGSWLNTYINYAHCVSPMTPVLFHESAALYLASMAIARRLVLHMPFGDIYPNLFILWVAVTTFFRKSTALMLARDISRDVFPFLLAAQDMTPEALLSDMAGKEPSFLASLPETEQQAWQKERNYAGQRGLFSDEMSGLLANSGKDYNQGMIEMLIRFYDCDPDFTRSTRGQGRITVKDAYLSILGASTPAAMTQYFSVGRLWEVGFWPRFALITPDVDRPPWKEAKEADRPIALTDKLHKLFNRLPEAVWPDHPQPLSVTLGDGVFQTWNKYNRALSYDLLLSSDLDYRLYGTYGRLPTQVLKIAIILSALDWTTGNAPRIELSHLVHAINIAECWRASAHRTISNTVNSIFDRESQRVIKVITRYEPQGATLRDLCRAIRDKKATEIELFLFDLIKAGEVEEVKTVPGKKGGRPTNRYRLARD